MAIRKFKVVSIDYNNYAIDYIGVSKDNHINSLSPTQNYGAEVYLNLSSGTWGHGNIILTVVMPDSSDIKGFGELIKVELVMRVGGIVLGQVLIVGISEISDIWDEGTGTASVPQPSDSNWTKAQTLINWALGDGAVKSRFGPIIKPEDGIQIDVQSMRFLNDYVAFDLTPVLSIGDTKNFVIWPMSCGSPDPLFAFYSRQNTIAANKSIVRVTYKDYSPEAFADKDSALTIEPNPNNPEQPLLKWGGVKDADFVDFKLYRETTPITTVALLTPIAIITSPADQEYVDVAAAVDGTTYYYLVIAEDGNNTLDDATFSNQIAWTKPDVNVATISPTGTQTVGTQITLTVGSPQKIKRVFVDWGDAIGVGDVESWYEYEVVSLSKLVTHIFSKYTIGIDVAIYVRVEDEKGFWSSLSPLTAASARFNDLDPLAKLMLNIKKDHVGVEIALNAVLSQPIASNVTITNYKFKRFAADPYQDNGTDPIYEFSTSGYTVGTKTATVLITTSSGKTATASVDYYLESGDPVELIFTNETRIHEISHDLGYDKEFKSALGSEGVEFQFKMARKAERITIFGTSCTPNMDADIGLLRSIWINDTYIRIRVKNEIEGKDVLYDGKIESDISLGHSYPNLITWSFKMVIFNRTEV